MAPQALSPGCASSVRDPEGRTTRLSIFRFRRQLGEGDFATANPAAPQRVRFGRYAVVWRYGAWDGHFAERWATQEFRKLRPLELSGESKSSLRLAAYRHFPRPNRVYNEIAVERAADAVR